MKFSSTCILFSALIVSDFNAFSQVTVFDNNTSTPSTFQRNKKVQSQNLVKINPFLFLNGDIPVYFEHVLSQSWTAEVAPGITYENYWWMMTQGGLNLLSGNNSIQWVDGTKPAVGFSFKADVKFFPGQENVLDGVYLSPEIGYRHYSIDYPNSTSNTSDYTKGHTNITDFKVIFGDEAESDWVDNFYYDWYVGLGLRTVSALQYIPGYDANNNSIMVAHSVSYSNPAFFFGLKIGIGF